ncbi:MAG: response regulator transcription factor [Rhodoferax sp.]|uniref:LytR/AlgR family response regulator transcription factor n=1 Tax=Rhodoferax sp. TaxID=50421 RepID=UPI0013FFA7A2|nr:LytTR family DNA-binding domain-containing protein [Rhodoferax sp.]NDP39628.1 response regulator transcription factor [Rhodoferax sp.]
MARALIADDERLMRDQLRARLAEVWPELEIVAEARNGEEAVALTTQHQPDIVFLDIRMPVLTGVDAARQIAQLPTYEEAGGWPGCEIVFITAYDQYAVQAFEQGVVDYVLKPAERERLQVTMERIKARMADRARPNANGQDGGNDSTTPLPTHTPGMQQLLQRLAEQISPKATPKLQWIQATVRQSIQMIPVSDVLFFISDEKYTRVQTATLEALIRKPIKELVEELDMSQFWQIHRSTLISTKAIAGVSRDERGRQLVSVRGLSEKLEVSRSYAGLFKSM